MKLHQSGNKIIVTELNPMCDAPNGESFLAYLIKGNIAWELYKTRDGKFSSLDDVHMFEEKHIQGWLPLPVYEPSEKE